MYKNLSLFKETENIYLKNNKSALGHSDFASSARVIKEILSYGIVEQVSNMSLFRLTIKVNTDCL